MGARRLRRGPPARRAGPALGRLLGVPLVPRDGPRVLRGPRGGGDDERPLRQRQGRPRGAPRRRQCLHGRRAGDDGPRRLADDGVHDGRRRSVLRRHLLPEAHLPPADGGDHRRVDAPTRGGDEQRRRTARGHLADRHPAPGRRPARPRHHQPHRASVGPGVRRRMGWVRGGAEVPVDDEPRPPAARPPQLRRSGLGSDRRRPRSTRWRPAACTTTSAAASPATRSIASGSSRTSRRCCTTRRCWCGSTPMPPSPSMHPRWRQIVAETVDYVLRDLRQDGGGFSSAEDADSPGPDGHGHEGLFHTWTPDEVRAVLGSDADAALAWWGITAAGNFEGRSIPNRLHAAGRLGPAAGGRGAAPAALRGARAAAAPGSRRQGADRVERVDGGGAGRGRRAAR